MAKEIRSRNIDILIDMDGYSNEGIAVRSLFAQRLAPVTASWFVYMGTTGQPNVDYIIADEQVLPPHVARWHSERVLQLPGPFFPISHAALFPDVETLDSTETKNKWRAKYRLPLVGEAVIFTSFNKVLKISPHIWAAWLHILKKVPNSILLMLENPKDAVPTLRQHFADAGLDPSRLRFCPFVNTSEEHIFRVAMADIILDTPPWGAHTGAADALWCAVPLVTTVRSLWGQSKDAISDQDAVESMASRVAHSLLHSSGVPELSGADLPTYTVRLSCLSQVLWVCMVDGDALFCCCTM